MIDQIQRLGEKALAAVESATGVSVLEEIRISILGKKGELSECLRGLAQLSALERPKVGAAANEWKTKIETALSAKKALFDEQALAETLKRETIDLTLPARRHRLGALHPITQTTRRIVEIFSKLGFDLMTGPEVETDYMCFEAVNIPADHPARDMQDTFFLGTGVLLRTQTTSIQTRALRSQSYPVRIICPGAVYRNDHDATHSPMFHQVEGLFVDRGVKMSDLKGTLEFFAREIFGEKVGIRLRPSYFPFVEPGAEVDVSCFRCAGKDASCRVCKGTGWLEILGAGMVHPRLLELAGYPADEVSGFAFGMGIDRIAMILHEISDLRLMFSGESRFVSQFSSP